jgi:outer membrane immunogenic protein
MGPPSRSKLGVSMNKRLLSAIALVAISGSSAWAAGPKTITGNAPAMPWTGFYVGALAGADLQSSGVVIPNYPASFAINTSGFNLGAKIGYNYQFSGPWVVGIEGSFAGNWNDGRHLSDNLGTEQYEVGSNWNASVVARAGYAFDNLLVYGKAGLAVANFDKLAYVPDLGMRKSNTYTGLALGAGIDYAITANWIVGVDYTYTAFDNKNFVYNGPTSVKPSTSIINASLSYKF